MGWKMKIGKSINKKSVSKSTLVLILLLIFTSPIIIYTLNFGFHLTADHQRWAEFGTFISGIYAPVLSLVTLLVLVSQYRMQNKMNEYQIEQTTISRLVNDNTQFLEAICRELDSAPYIRTKSVEDILMDHFFFLSADDLANDEKYRSAIMLYKKVPKISDCWMALTSTLATLEMIEGSSYKAAFSSELLRVQSTLSHGTCTSLDNYMRCLKVVPYNNKVYFSEI